MNSTRTPPPLPTSLEVEGPVPLALQGLPLLPLLMAQREFPGLHRLEFILSEPLKKVIADGPPGNREGSKLAVHQYAGVSSVWEEVLEEDEPQSRCHSAAVFTGRVW